MWKKNHHCLQCKEILYRGYASWFVLNWWLTPRIINIFKDHCVFPLVGSESCPTLCDTMDCPWNSSGQNTGVGSLSLPQGIFPIQESNPGLPHCRQIHYQLSQKGSLRRLEWVAFPFSRGSSQPRNQTRVSCIAGGFFTNWAQSLSSRLWHLLWSS